MTEKERRIRESPEARKILKETIDKHHAFMDAESGDIFYGCPLCGDNGVIRDWKDTGWDRSGSAGYGDCQI